MLNLDQTCPVGDNLIYFKYIMSEKPVLNNIVNQTKIMEWRIIVYYKHNLTNIYRRMYILQILRKYVLLRAIYGRAAVCYLPIICHLLYQAKCPLTSIHILALSPQSRLTTGGDFCVFILRSDLDCTFQCICFSIYIFSFVTQLIHVFGEQLLK